MKTITTRILLNKNNNIEVAPDTDEGYHIMDSTIVFLLILLALIIIPIIVKFQVNEKKKE